MPSWRSRLEAHFEFDRLNTHWRKETLAGCTTFLTMAYIIFVNPAILAQAGVPASDATTATCWSAAIASILMGALARYPIALAPGMGLNAYFTYSVVKGMGISWEVALGAVFLSGSAFLLLTILGLRRMIVEAIPAELYSAVAAGIGLFIALVGFQNAGFVKPHPSTMISLGNLGSLPALLSMSGLALTASLMAWRVRAAILLGILTTAAAARLFGASQWTFSAPSMPRISGTLLRLDIAGALSLGLAEVVFVFLFVDLFDNLGTLLGVGKKAGLFDNSQRIPRLERILTTDSIATIVGSLLGTSTVVSYIESAAGVAAGGRSGVTAIVAGLLFLAASWLAPAFGAIPGFATAPALILVGALMASHVREIDWDDPQTAVPAFLTMAAIPLTYSIANGLAIGFTIYVLLRVACRRFADVHWLLYVLSAIFIFRFLYLGTE